jgi:hypothetical protein
VIRYQVPDADQHSGYCRTYAWRWRFTATPEVRNDLAAWPCVCPTPGPWRYTTVRHPAWCVVEGEHLWYDCAIPGAVPTKKE